MGKKISQEELNKRMQQVVTNNRGYNARILNWRNSHDIDIIFEDGLIIYNKTYESFKKGEFAHPFQVGLVKDLSGRKYGRLTVVGDSGRRDNSRSVIWECKCECGNTCYVRRQSLENGNTKSCGCFQKDELKLRLSLYRKSALNKIIRQYKSNANSRKLSWNLSEKEVEEIIHKPCFYCGVKDTNKVYTKSCKEGYSYNGIDRVDSSTGYNINNVVPCCKTCNIAKHNMTQKEFYLWIERAFNYSKLGKQ